MASERDTMAGLTKGLLVIETFTADRSRQSISDVAKASGLDRATARRCLLTLSHHGYADYDGKYFTLTPRILRLGTACLATMPLPQLVQPLLDGISERLGESSSVCILDGPEIVYVARAAQRKVMSIALMPGSRLPAFCTSMGRVLLAALPVEQASRILTTTPLFSRTRYTKTDVDRILEELELVKRQGFALIDQEVEIGLRSIAVPVFNAREVVVAALNVGVPATQEISDLVSLYLSPLLQLQSELRGVLR